MVLTQGTCGFRELVADERLQKDYWPLYTLLRRAAAAPLLAFPGNDEEATLEVHKTPCVYSTIPVRNDWMSGAVTSTRIPLMEVLQSGPHAVSAWDAS